MSLSLLWGSVRHWATSLTFTIVIADDHPLFREAMRIALGDLMAASGVESMRHEHAISDDGKK